MLSAIKRSPVMLAAAIVVGVPATLEAQYAGPTTQPAPATVAEVLKQPVDDQDVALQGYLLRKVGKEKYMFSDGTGEIRVDIESEDFPAVQVDEKTRIHIRGEVEKDFFESPEIDVKAITLVS